MPDANSRLFFSDPALLLPVIVPVPATIIFVVPLIVGPVPPIVMPDSAVIVWAALAELIVMDCVDVPSVRFQSLLSWIGFRDRNDNPRRDRRISVSILVVVDWVQRLDGFGKCDEAYKVSILVVVDWVQRLSG